MPVPVMVRLDDDVAEKLRARAYVERRSLNRVINDIVRHHLAAEGLPDAAQAVHARTALAEGVRQQADRLQEAIMGLNRQETDRDVLQKVVDALVIVNDYVQASRFVVSPESIPTVRDTERDEVPT